MAIISRSRVLSLKEIERVYPDTWVLIEVTREHTPTGRLGGRVLPDSKDRAAISDAIAEVRRGLPAAELYVHFTGPGLDPEFDGAIAL
jgi:hypothetical protein